MNETTMLGTYTLDGNVPVSPEIVLANCHDTAMLGRLVAMFEGDPDIKFFIVHEVDRASVDLGAAFHFVRDAGSWVLANNDTLHPVLFDDASFNPGGHEGTFSLTPLADGSYFLDTGGSATHGALLVDTPGDDIFANGTEAAPAEHDPHADANSNSLFIDPSVLGDGQSEIVVSNFTFGSDHLELADHLSVKDVVVDNENDQTSIILSQNDHAGDDIVVKLLGVAHPDIPAHDFPTETDHSTDDLINHLIHSGRNVD
ncbi:hypothetical protein LF599_13750 [Pseudodesulfovibrio thermohalotolerans]|uniref:hypothetical protein n=1 Tax=Pseudodesulfovibrio thermohalotolerans TaxID=2880651 RepID=UPI002442CBBF|nr:hypothetical protein [Pseudodesulfovibrio thermohalotolerans]WFS61729.1 hypothetical protein LF599_13750 [Pseudodesulfovibrio thermohalotolerans]